MQANADKLGNNSNREEDICEWAAKWFCGNAQGRTERQLEMMEHSLQRVAFQLQAEGWLQKQVGVYRVSKLTDERATNFRGWMHPRVIPWGPEEVQHRRGSWAWSHDPHLDHSCVLCRPSGFLCHFGREGLAGEYCTAYVSFDRGWPVWRFCSNLFSQPDSEGWEKPSCW